MSGAAANTVEIPAELVEQFAMYMQRRDAFEQGMVGADGVARPTWEELGPDGWNAYMKDAVAYVGALVQLGMRPAEPVPDVLLELANGDPS